MDVLLLPKPYEPITPLDAFLPIFDIGNAFVQSRVYTTVEYGELGTHIAPR